MSGALAVRPVAGARSDRWLTTVLGALLVAFCILLPLDWGFPRIPVLGRPLSAAIAASVGLFGVLSVVSGGRIMAYLYHPYALVQSGYVAMLVIASLRSPSPPVALHSSLLYFCTFVLNYASLVFVVREGGVRRFEALVVAAGVVAAAVGIAQGLFDVRLQLYQDWYMAYFQREAPDPTMAEVRSVGTLNNPILYGMAMVLLVPYLAGVRRLWLRVPALAAVLIAAGLSGSRTVLLVLGVLVVGGAVVYGWRMLAVVPFAILGFFMLVQSLGGWNNAGNDIRVRYLLGRLGLVEAQSAVVADVNVAIRKEVLTQGSREILSQWGPVTLAIGKGQFASTAVGQRISAGYSTVDNAYFGVLYEKGSIGLALFLASYVTFLRRTRAAAKRTLHWYAPLCLLVAGVSFNFDAFSTFNVLAVASMAIATVVVEDGRRASVPEYHGVRERRHV